MSISAVALDKPPPGTKVLILLGGGLDSITLLLWLKAHGRDVRGIFFSYGQIATTEEYRAIVHFCTKLKVGFQYFEVPLYKIAHSAILDRTEKGNKLEGRNAVFVMLAATYAATIGCDEIHIGFHREPLNAPFPDATVHALQAMNGVLEAAYNSSLTLCAPFAHKSRSDILRIGYELDPEILTKSHTCYLDVRGGCGECVHCKQREVLIQNLLNGTDLPLPENA